MGQTQYPRERDRAGLLPHATERARARSSRAEGGHLRQNADGTGRTRGGVSGRGNLFGVAGVIVRDRRDDRGGRRIPGPGNLKRKSKVKSQKCFASVVFAVVHGTLQSSSSPSGYTFDLCLLTFDF